MKPTRRSGKKAAPSESAPPLRADASNLAEERLLVEAAQSDPAQFEALYELNFERVYAYVAARVRDRPTAEDVTSEVFHKALAHLPSYEWRGVPFAAWLLRIAANAVIDQAKRASREVAAGEDPPEPTKAEVRVVEDRARLFRMVRELPETQRQVVHQRFVEQRSIREIAERLGKTEGAIKQLQLRALERLRAQMGGGHG